MHQEINIRALEKRVIRDDLDECQETIGKRCFSLWSVDLAAYNQLRHEWF